MKKIYNEKILKIFMILQPIIDIITSIMINEYDLLLSIGMIIRFLFLIYTTGYLFINRNKKIIGYILLWFIYCLTSLVGNYYIKDNFNILEHTSSLLKMVYFPMILLFWIIYYKNNKEIDKKVFIYIGLLVGLSLALSCLTKTAYCSYSNYENCYTKGVVAWFNSANEYGLILIALLGLIMLDYLKKYNASNIVALLFVIVFLSILGTKASYIGLVGVISIYIIYYFINYFVSKKKKKKQKDNLKSVIYLSIVLALVLISTPKLPIYGNLVGNYSRAYKEASQTNKSEEEIEKEVKDKIVFNGRSEFSNNSLTLYKNSKSFNKFFGLTFQGNYINGSEYKKTNERDFHDLLMYYGIVAFILEMLLPIYLLINIFKKVFKNFKVLLNDEIIVLAEVICFILLGSFIAGHCLFQPAVSIYLAYLVALFYKKVVESK